MNQSSWENKCNFIEMYESPIKRRNLPQLKDFGMIRRPSAFSETAKPQLKQYSIQDDPEMPFLRKAFNNDEQPLQKIVRQRKPSFRSDLLLKPRFAVNQSQTISDGDDLAQSKESKQLLKQIPLPSENLKSSQYEKIKFKQPSEITYQRTNRDVSAVDQFNLRHINQSNTNSMLQHYTSSAKPPVFQPQKLYQIRQHIKKITRSKQRHCSPNEESEENQTSHINNNSEVFQHYSNKKQKQKPQKYSHQKIQISYRTSLSSLQKLGVSFKGSDIAIRIPKLFTEDLIYQEQNKNQLYRVAKDIFKQLKIPHQCLVIKRYYNCVMLICNNICFIWHYSGKRYLGGWQTQYLDQGVKHGLGLQWKPGKEVYYGQFKSNERHGLGAYKDAAENVYFGQWIGGKQVESSKDKSERSSINDTVQFQEMP